MSKENNSQEPTYLGDIGDSDQRAELNGGDGNQALVDGVGKPGDFLGVFVVGVLWSRTDGQLRDEVLRE
jgi:hypothetical protein